MQTSRKKKIWKEQSKKRLRSLDVLTTQRKCLLIPLFYVHLRVLEGVVTAFASPAGTCDDRVRKSIKPDLEKDQD